MKIYYLLLISMIIACNSELPGDVNKIYDNRAEILQIFEDVTLNERRSAILLEIKSDSLVNNYYLIRNKVGELEIDTCHIQFNINEFKNLYFKKEDNNIEKFALFCLNKKYEYHINFVDDFKDLGITHVFMLKRGYLYYISNVSDITNPNWIDCIQSAKQLDENWYWSPSPRKFLR